MTGDQTQQEKVLSTDERLKRYEQALRDILDPIGKVRRELPEGYVLNGAACVHSLKDPETYKAIAREALEGT